MLLKYTTLFSCINFLLLAVILLLRKSADKRSNAILFVLFLTMALYSGLVFFHYTALGGRHYAWLTRYAPVDGMVLLAMGPFLYYYCLSVLRLPLRFYSPKSLLHLLPFLPYLAFNVHFVMWPEVARINWLTRDFSTGTTEMNLLNGVLYAQIICYLSICYRIVSKKLKLSSVIMSDTVEIDVSWLRTYLLLNLWFILLSLPVCFYFANEQANLIIGQLGMDIQFVYMFFKWTLHTEFIVVVRESELPARKITPITENDCTDKYLQLLTLYMEHEEPYLDEKCSVQTVSEDTGIPYYQLTNLLNTVLQKTFPDYINHYRIQKAKQMLLLVKSNGTTLESIATECGFGSRSAFHRSFKKLNNGLTPTGFIQQQQKATEND